VLPNDFSACPSDVLIVEDDPIIALDFEDNLWASGFRRCGAPERLQPRST
jgi:hypothetical protein